MKIYFFGTTEKRQGHYLHNAALVTIWWPGKRLPFRYTILDAGLLGDQDSQPLGKFYHAQINGWTVLGMWDRSVDQRRNSNASFIIEGLLSPSEAEALVAKDFPKTWARIVPQLPVIP